MNNEEMFELQKSITEADTLQDAFDIISKKVKTKEVVMTDAFSHTLANCVLGIVRFSDEMKRVSELAKSKKRDA